MIEGRSNSSVARLACAGKGRPLAVLVLAAVFLLQITGGGSDFNRLRQAAFDFYQRLQPRAVESIPVAIVDIDEQTLRQFGQWPWPRTKLASLIEKTHELGALAIGLDIILAEPDRMSPQEFADDYPGLPAGLESGLRQLPSNDDLLAATLRRVPVVLGRSALPAAAALAKGTRFTPVQVEGEGAVPFLIPFSGHLPNVPTVAGSAAGYGYLNATLDPDGVVRRMPALLAVDGKIVPSMGLELLRVALRANWLTVTATKDGIQSVTVGEAVIETDSGGLVTPHFSGHHPQRLVSASEVLSGKASAKKFAGQVVLIGVTGLGLGDVVTTPVSSRISGVEVQAQFIENLLFNTRLKRGSEIFKAELLALALSGALLIFILPWGGPIRGAAALGVLLASQFGASFVAFSQARLLVDPTHAALGSAVVFLSLVISHMTEADRKRRALDAELAAGRLITARMSGELAAARDIQMGILPDPDDIEGLPPGLVVNAFLEPAREVGGDLYDFFMIDDQRLYFMIGDVSGKGVPASLFMALSKALCKSAALRDSTSVADLMMVANAEISRENPAFMFVTAVAGILDVRTGDIEFCNAGHDHPYVVLPGTPPHPLESVGGPPLCVMDDFPYPVERARLKPGETLLLTTDGVGEAMTVDNEMYGTARMVDLLASFSGAADADDLIPALYKDVKNFVGEAEPNDDITILSIKYQPPGRGVI